MNTETRHGARRRAWMGWVLCMAIAIGGCEGTVDPELTDGERRVTGMALKDLALRGLVPLMLVEWAHEYPLKFRLP